LSELIRAFLAFELNNPSVRKNIVDIQSMVIKTGADLKIVEPDNIHITIRFLGDIRPNMIDEVFKIMQKVKFAPFVVKLFGLGAFPSPSYPRVLWAGITEGASKVEDVFKQLELGLQRLDFASDKRGFSPHLTIARVRSGRNKELLAQFLTEEESHDFGEITINCLRLKSSELTPKGPIYTTLKEYCSQL
jgi:2'-5' RNA ligase